ncbi:hypothetical protein [Luteirhabdus pelagi]|uniref:hypothetical protein n=1 Tax=Luteirhabdus pelagi TaxID=2792783 RepID=UPI00193A5AFF|nr:hypothetical protein [Luteirhabdus pelagi]
MKFLLKFQLCLFLYSSVMLAQVGIGTTAPEAQLDIQSSNSGLLIPRVALASDTDITTVTNPEGTPLAESTMVYNTGTGGLTEAGFYFWNGASWDKLIDNTPSMWVGKATITGTGNLIVNGLPFQPKRVVFTAYANIESYNINADNGVGNNNNGIPNTYGSMQGFAYDDGGTIQQQVIFNGGSGNSINDISRYSSDSHCVGIRYANNNGNNLGITSASLANFTSSGFRLNVDSHVDNLVIIYQAYRY